MSILIISLISLLYQPQATRFMLSKFSKLLIANLTLYLKVHHWHPACDIDMPHNISHLEVHQVLQFLSFENYLEMSIFLFGSED